MSDTEAQRGQALPSPTEALFVFGALAIAVLSVWILGDLSSHVESGATLRGWLGPPISAKLMLLFLAGLVSLSFADIWTKERESRND